MSKSTYNETEELRQMLQARIQEVNALKDDKARLLDFIRRTEQQLMIIRAALSLQHVIVPETPHD